MIAVPPALLELLNLRAGSPVGMTIEEGKLILEPAPKPRYSLDELLAVCDPEAPLSAEDQQWLEGRPQGRELL